MTKNSKHWNHTVIVREKVMSNNRSKEDIQLILIVISGLFLRESESFLVNAPLNELSSGLSNRFNESNGSWKILSNAARACSFFSMLMA